MSEDLSIQRKGTVLVAIDGSTPAQSAGEVAVRIAQHFDYRVLGLYVVDETVVLNSYEDYQVELGSTTEEPRSQAELVDWFKDQGAIALQWLESLCKAKGVDYSSLILFGGVADLSFLIQGAISKRLKYHSLYEAQVPSRADSPAHHLEQLEAAIHLLSKRGVYFPMTISHLDLRALLASGIPVDLPDGKRLVIGVLRPKTSFNNKTIQQSFPLEGQDEVEVVALFRQGHTLLPHPELVLKAGDRVLFVASPHAWADIEKNFEPL